MMFVDVPCPLHVHDTRVEGDTQPVPHVHVDLLGQVLIPGGEMGERWGREGGEMGERRGRDGGEMEGGRTWGEDAKERKRKNEGGEK